MYYIESRPEISDRDYDRLMQELIDIERHPELLTPDFSTQRVGGDVQGELKAVRYAVPMMSIDNTYTAEEVRAFDEARAEARWRREAALWCRQPEDRRGVGQPVL